MFYDSVTKNCCQGFLEAFVTVFEALKDQIWLIIYMEMWWKTSGIELVLHVSQNTTDCNEIKFFQQSL